MFLLPVSDDDEFLKSNAMMLHISLEASDAATPREQSGHICATGCGCHIPAHFSQIGLSSFSLCDDKGSTGFVDGGCQEYAYLYFKKQLNKQQ